MRLAAVNNAWMQLEAKTTKAFFLCALGRQEVLDPEGESLRLGSTGISGGGVVPEQLLPPAPKAAPARQLQARLATRF